MAVSLRAGLSRVERCRWVLAGWVPVWGRRAPKSAGSRARRKAGGAKSSELSAAVLQASSSSESCAGTTRVCLRKRAGRADFKLQNWGKGEVSHWAHR